MASQINFDSKKISKNLNQLLNFTLSLFMLMLVCSSCSKESKDKDIKADLTSKAKDKLDFAAVSFTVEDGIVTLTGKCSSAKSKAEVEKTVKDINIVKGIINNIVIAPVVVNADYPLKQAADSVLNRYPTVKAEVSDGKIVLEGKVGKKDIDKMLTALNNLHPAKINNQLKLE